MCVRILTLCKVGEPSRKTRHILSNLNKCLVELSYILEECEHRTRGRGFLCFGSGPHTDILGAYWQSLAALGS